jgi:hypothetical protein
MTPAQGFFSSPPEADAAMCSNQLPCCQYVLAGIGSPCRGGAYVPHFGMYAPSEIECCDRIHARKRHVCATRACRGR